MKCSVSCVVLWKFFIRSFLKESSLTSSKVRDVGSTSPSMTICYLKTPPLLQNTNHPGSTELRKQCVEDIHELNFNCLKVLVRFMSKINRFLVSAVVGNWAEYIYKRRKRQFLRSNYKAGHV